ncbi:MAG: hypothetical protein ISS87_02890 [Candidatus Pacebacteria bacterium]|nr:hypothetical protein [Candidatus Paceibacterota bacterium]
MIIEKILKQLTSERIEKEIKAIQKVKLPPELQKWVKEYEKVGDRDEFIWKWIFKIPQINTFSSVSQKYLISLQNTKFLVSMFFILIDDISDKMKNKKLLDTLMAISFSSNLIQLNSLSSKEKKYFQLTIKLWNHIEKEIKKYPRYKKFRDIFIYDFRQTTNAMLYAYLINKNLTLINNTEYWLYAPHGFQGMVYSTLDLMCSPSFNIKELRPVREIIWRTQIMIGIGNWVSTWERELKDNDFTSGVFIYALNFKVLTTDDFKKENEPDVVKKIKESKIEKRLLEKWGSNYNEINKIGKKIRTINIRKFLRGLKKLLVLEMSSKGHK